MRNHRRSSRSSPIHHGMDSAKNVGEGKANSVPQNNDAHRYSPGNDLNMMQKSYVHRDAVPEEMMGFNQGYEMAPANNNNNTNNNNLEQNCNNDTGAATNRIHAHPFGPFAPTPPGSAGTNSSASPFCAQSGAIAAAAAAAVGLSQQSGQMNHNGGTPSSFMDTPPSSFCSTPYNYSLYSMHSSQDSRVKLEKEKEVVVAAAAAAAYNSKHGIVEDKELAASKWLPS